MKILHLMKKELIEVWRQKQMLVLMLIMPAIQVVLLGYVLTTEIRNVPVEIVNLSSGHQAAMMVNRIRATPQFHVRRVRVQPDNYLERLRQGDVKAILLLRDPPGKSGNLLSYPEVQILMDGIDSNTALIAAGYFNGVLQNYVLSDLSRRGAAIPISAHILIRFNPDLRSIRYMGPGMVAILLTTLTIFLTSVSLVREREQQTLDSLLISPLHPLEIYLGKALPIGLLAMVSMAIGIAVMVFWFDVPIRGNLLDLLLAVLVYETALMAYGLFISTVTSTQQEAMFFAWFSMITFLLLSGFMTPVENIPPAIRLITHLNPTFYMMIIIREIFLKGNGFAFFWKELLALSAITVVMTSVSLMNFKRFVSK
jgi:ABC-2 type transport system permease protein